MTDFLGKLPLGSLNGLVKKNNKITLDSSQGKFYTPTCTSTITHLICPTKFCVTFVFHFSWVLHLQSPHEKLKTLLMEFFWGGGGGGGGGEGKNKKVHYVRCASAYGFIENPNWLNQSRKSEIYQ